ncbi:MAG: efflux RND transporter periplasmic adaptor subunit [Pseudomonadota bacterium]
MKRSPSLLLLLLFTTIVWGENIPVHVQPLHELLRQAEFSAPASVKPLNAPSLAAEISARIETIPVLVGEQVNKGDPLAELDCRYHQSRLQAARAGLQRIDAQLQFADAQLKRAKDLKAKRSISDEVLDQRRAELLGARADRLSQQELIHQAEIDVQRCTINAPFDAVVTERLAQVGDLANPGTPLLKLIQLEDLEVSAELRGSETKSLGQVQAIRFEYAGSDYALRLRRLLPVIDERTRTQQARLSFTQEAAPAGAAGRLIWQGAADELPADYLVRRDGSLGIFLVADGLAHFHRLEHAREGQPVRLQLMPDIRLVTDGRQRLQDGDPVSILEKSDR